MTEYKGYKIKSTCGFFEISKGGKFLRNAMSIEIAKEYIDSVETARY